VAYFLVCCRIRYFCKMRKICTSLVFLLVSVYSRSQSIRYYSDSLIKMTAGSFPGSIDYNKVIHDGIYSYIQGSSTINGTNNTTFTTIIKIDTSGKTIWTSSPVNYFAEGIEPIQTYFSQFIFGVDRHLYSLLNTRKLAKIRETNGSVDWIAPISLPANSHHLKLLDYDNNSGIIAAGSINPDSIQLYRFDKANGNSLGMISIYCPGPVFNYFYGIYIHPNGNIFVANKDTCYKYTSFTNPTLAWKTTMFPSPTIFEDIGKIIQEGNNVLVFGKEGTPIGSDNGLLSCLNATTGAFKWVHHNSGPQDMNYGDHKIRNGFLYTTWQYASTGSTTNKCYINKIDTSNGNTAWEFNHPFNTLFTITPAPETMTSMQIDNNDIIYLTGYGKPDNYPVSAWGFMKIRGSDGTVLNRSYVTGSDLTNSLKAGFTVRLFNNKLYLTGKMTWKEASGRMDTATLTAENIQIDSSAIQLTSSVTSVKNYSANKKIVIKRVGKKLTVELLDLFGNRIWQKQLGDTIRHYEAFDLIHVNDFSKRIYIASRKFIFNN